MCREHFLTVRVLYHTSASGFKVTAVFHVSFESGAKLRRNSEKTPSVSNYAKRQEDKPEVKQWHQEPCTGNKSRSCMFAEDKIDIFNPIN